MRGFQAMALSSRCQTNQFSTQPAISELRNSSTPVKAAKKAVGPSSVSVSSTCCASRWSMSGWPNAARQPNCTASTIGVTAARLPKMPAACERISCATSSTKLSTCSSVERSRSFSAIAGRRHRRLLGGHGEMQQLHEHEARRVVDAGPEAAPERREREREHRELDEGGGGQHRAAAERRAQHAAVFLARAGDVVLARLGAALGDLAREQRVVAAHQPADAAARVGGAHEFGEQARDLARGLRADHAAQQRIDAVRALAQLVDLEHHVDRHAMRLQVLVHAGGAATAGVEQRAQVLNLLHQRGLALAARNGHRRRHPARRRILGLRVVAHLFGHARQLPERGGRPEAPGSCAGRRAGEKPELRTALERKTIASRKGARHFRSERSGAR